MPTKPHHNKRGPRPHLPSTAERRRVELGIAGGLSAASLAKCFNMPVTTFKRCFTAEIENGRVAVTLDALSCLDKEARGGSTAAAKALLGFIERAAKPDLEAVTDKWAGLADRIHASAANLVDQKFSPWEQ